MDEKPDEIMNHIESERDQLGRNLNELETRVRRTTDWRAQVDRNPMLAMGVALGGGVLLGSIIGGSHRSSKSAWSSSAAGKSYTSANLASSTSAASTFGAGGSGRTSQYHEQRRKTSDTLDNIKAALIAFGTAKVKEFMSEALPGFHEHMEQAERHSTSSRPDSYSSGSQFGAPEYSGSSGQRSSEYQTQGSGSASQYPGGTRTEQSSRSPYPQQPRGSL
jgi:hypothetical protein